MKSKGFTLVELLVVISIISILSVIGFATYQIILKNSRDFKRTSDLKTIQSVLEQYHADQLYYLTAETGAICHNDIFHNFDTANPTVFCPLKGPGGTRKYLDRIPEDPITGTTYNYLYVPSPTACDNGAGGKCTSYCLYAKAENSSNAVNTSCIDDTNRTLEMTQP